MPEELIPVADSEEVKGSDGAALSLLKPHELARAVLEHHWPASLDPWMRTFCDALAYRPSMRDAARAANCSVRTAERYAKAFPEFGESIKAAIDMGWQNVEDAAYDRAVHGTLKNTYDRKGNLLHSEIVYSDRLAETLLQGNRPEKYNRKFGDTINVGVKMEVVDVLRKIRNSSHRMSDAKSGISATEVKPLPRARTGPGRRQPEHGPR